MPKYKVFYHNEQPPSQWIEALVNGRVNKHLEKFHEHYKEVTEITATDIDAAWHLLNEGLADHRHIRSMSVGDTLVNPDRPDIVIVCMPSGWENVTLPNILKKGGNHVA